MTSLYLYLAPIYTMAIDEAIGKAQAVLSDTLAGEHSMLIGVHREVLKAQALQKKIIPILINDLEG
jgi:hypothetical protein